MQWKMSGESLFAGQAKVVTNPECKKYIIHYSENFQGNSVFFQGKGKLLKNRELWKNYQNSVYSLGGDPCNLG